MNKSSIYVFGEVLYDCFPGTLPVLGGAPFNVAWHLRAFGESPVLISATGDDDLGRKIRDAMKAWDLSTGLLQVDAAHPTGVVTVTIENNEPSYDIRDQVAYDFINAEQLPALEAGALLYHGSLALRHEQTGKSFELLRQSISGRRFVDVNLRSPWWRRQDVLDTLGGAFLVKLNIEELLILVRIPQADVSDKYAVLDVTRDFRQKHNIVNLLVTRSDRGALLAGTEGEIFGAEVKPLSNPVVDTVGAGDAYAAVTILGIQQGWDWQTTMERAGQFAAFIVTQRGAICTDKSVYERFRRLWDV